MTAAGTFAITAWEAEPPYDAPAEGPPLFFFNDEAATIESLRRHSPRDAEAYPKFQAMLEKIGDFLRPMLLRPPPALGSRAPGEQVLGAAWATIRSARPLTADGVGAPASVCGAWT